MHSVRCISYEKCSLITKHLTPIKGRHGACLYFCYIFFFSFFSLFVPWILCEWHIFIKIKNECYVCKLYTNNSFWVSNYFKATEVNSFYFLKQSKTLSNGYANKPISIWRLCVNHPSPATSNALNVQLPFQYMKKVLNQWEISQDDKLVIELIYERGKTHMATSM